MTTVAVSPNFAGEGSADTTTRLIDHDLRVSDLVDVSEDELMLNKQVPEDELAEIVCESPSSLSSYPAEDGSSEDGVVSQECAILNSSPPPDLPADLEALVAELVEALVAELVDDAKVEAWVAELADDAEEPELNISVLKDVSEEYLAENLRESPPQKSSSSSPSYPVEDGSPPVVENVVAKEPERQVEPGGPSHPNISQRIMGDQFIQRRAHNVMISPTVYGPNHSHYLPAQVPPFRTPSPYYYFDPIGANRPPMYCLSTEVVTRPSWDVMHHRPDYTLMQPVALDYRGMPFRLPMCHIPPASLYYPVPNDPRQSMIVKQVEYYFSESNLVKDVFLRSNMDEEGWVTIPLIANFPRIKQLTKSLPFIVQCLRSSNALQVQGNRIRKRDNWRKWILPSVECSHDKPAATEASSSEGNTYDDCAIVSQWKFPFETIHTKIITK